jgi:hypothetical protein
MLANQALTAARPSLPLGQPIKRARFGRARVATPGRALFLDFDGVLHPTTIGMELESEQVIGTGLFGWLPPLASVLRPHPDVVVVVHSTWRYTHDVAELRELLGVLGRRVVGATPRGPRYESITWWLQQNPSFTSYRILDDDTAEFPDPLPAELVLCDPRRGVSSPEVLAALKDWLDRSYP